jgi:hypothetical protein
VVRFSNEEVLDDVEAVAMAIAKRLCVEPKFRGGKPSCRRSDGERRRERGQMMSRWKWGEPIAPMQALTPARREGDPGSLPLRLNRSAGFGFVYSILAMA